MGSSLGEIGSLDILEAGEGRPVLFLASGLWIADERPFINDLARAGHIIAPTHPWFGERPGPTSFGTADDLAYLYLDLLDARDLRDVVLVGAGFGGFVAAQMAVKSCERLAGVVLINSMGIKVGPRDVRDIVDVFATTDHDLETLAFADPGPFRREPRMLDDAALASRLRRREATARYGWQPYMHDPKLRERLHRIRRAALVLWGEQDRIVTPEYGRAFAEAVPGARFELVPQAGHFPHLERPGDVVECIAAFSRTLPRT